MESRARGILDAQFQRALTMYFTAPSASNTMNSTMDHANDRSSSPRERVFHLFGKLPLEVRLLIFEIAAINAGRARSIITVEVEVKFIEAAKLCDLTFKVLKSWDTKLDAAVRDLSLSVVNQESRKAYLKVFKYELQAKNEGSSTESRSVLRVGDAEVVYLRNFKKLIHEIYNSDRYPKNPISPAPVKAYFEALQYIAIPFDYLRPRDPKTRNPVWGTIESSFCCFPNLKRLDLISEDGNGLMAMIDKKHDVFNWIEDRRVRFIEELRTKLLGKGWSEEKINDKLASEFYEKFISKRYSEMRVQIRNWRGKIMIGPAKPGEVQTD